MQKYLTNLRPIDRLDEYASDNLWLKPISCLRLMQRIRGECTGAEGYKGIWVAKRDGIEEEFVARVFDSHVPENIEEVVRDGGPIRKLRHKHVLRCYGIYKHENYGLHVIIFEFAKGRSLFNRLENLKPFSEKDAAHIIRQIAEALKYIHGKNVIHRNVIPGNIFFKEFPSSHLRNNAILLGDFRLAHVSKDKTASGILGRIAYAAPEMLHGDAYTEKVDMWSLGVITYELLSGVRLFPGKNNDKTAMLVKEKDIVPILEMWQGISQEAKDFITNCLNRVPTERMSAKEALKHEWLRKKEPGSQPPSKASETAEGSNSPVTKRRKANQPLASATSMAASSSKKQNTTPDPVAAAGASKGTDVEKRSNDGNKARPKGQEKKRKEKVGSNPEK